MKKKKHYENDISLVQPKENLAFHIFFQWFFNDKMFSECIKIPEYPTCNQPKLSFTVDQIKCLLS